MPSAAETTLLLATRSSDKAREIRAILDGMSVLTVTLDDVGFPPGPEEDGVEAFDSYLLNAHAKAAWFLQRTGFATIADDSGLNVDALGGEPGVRSRRFAACADADSRARDAANNELLLDRLATVPGPLRSAHYTCAAVLHTLDGRRCAALGTCAGRILESPRGRYGFGYDPLFCDLLTGASFAELDPAEKDRRSHRARAFRALAAAARSTLDHPDSSR